MGFMMIYTVHQVVGLMMRNDIQELIDNINGKSKVGIIVWFLSLWNLMGILLFIPFLVMMYIMIIPFLLIMEPKQALISLLDFIKSKLIKYGLQEKLLSISLPKKDDKKESVLPPQPRCLLPFSLKSKQTLIVSPTVYGEFTERELATGIIKCSATYLKQQLNSAIPFETIDPKIIMPYLSKMYNGNDVDLSIVNGIGTTIHQCVWQLMLANTGIDSREYLPFGGNYSKYLAELLEDFGEVPVAKGIQIYTENLIDYYLSKLKYH